MTADGYRLFFSTIGRLKNHTANQHLWLSYSEDVSVIPGTMS
jgi:hypothetical protein